MKKSTTFRLSADALKLLAAMAARRGLSNTAMLEMLIRERAEADPPPPQR